MKTQRSFFSILFFSVFFFFSCNPKQPEDKNDTKKSFSKHEMDSIAKSNKDSLRMVALKKTQIFPLIKSGGDGSGVLPVVGIDEFPDTNKEYKLLFDFSRGNEDSTLKKPNMGLVEIARIWNLHAYSGIPINKIHVVVITHGEALFSVMNEDAFKKKFKKENPSNKLLEELMRNGAKFICCGQAMQFVEVKKEDLHVGVKVALTAKVVLSNYLEQGYVNYEISGE